jgi:hypothetical protein
LFWPVPKPGGKPMSFRVEQINAANILNSTEYFDTAEELLEWLETEVEDLTEGHSLTIVKDEEDAFE